MKAHTISLPFAAAVALLAAGCASNDYASANNPNQTARGAVAGAATGAVLGSVIGNNSGSGNAEKGAVIGAVAGGLAGAAIGHRADERETAAQPPVYSADTNYTVQSVPPAPVSEPQENIPPQPSGNAVWIRGHYEYNGNGYQWMSGHWEVPPGGMRAYIGPSWQPAANGGYVYVRGHWQ